MSSIFIAHFSQTLNNSFNNISAIFSTLGNCLTILSLFPLLQIMHVVILNTECDIKVLAGGQIAIFPGRQVHWLTNNSNKRDRSSNPIWPMMWHRGRQKKSSAGTGEILMQRALKNVQLFIMSYLSTPLHNHFPRGGIVRSMKDCCPSLSSSKFVYQY